MAAPRFVHLRMHTEFSIVDSTLRVDDAVALAAKDEQAALAVTDLSNLFGFVKFYKAARAKNVKPICGVDAWIDARIAGDSSSGNAEPFRVILLAENHSGYLKICQWITRAFRENQVRGKAMIDRAWLDGAGATEGVFCLSGGWFGDVGIALRNGQHAAAERAAAAWSARFPGAYAMEIHRAGFENEHHFIEHSVALAGKLKLPLVATHPMQFATADDFKAHEARVCIAEGYTLSDPRRPKHFTEKQRFVTQDEMCEKFADYPQAVANTVALAIRCTLNLTLGKNYLPDFPLPEGVTIEAHLRNEVLAGLEQRLAVLYPHTEARDNERPRYVERCDFEINTIVKMGFPGYFLIVADFIAWAKNNGVPVGPGRGSGAGSLVAYSLGITDLDPLKYNLLFERFLNPERVSMPDFDIDFCQDGRDRVINYVRQKYGAESVGQIATFGTMAAKAAVRDCGRVLDMPYTFVDGVAKLIPFMPGKWITLTKPEKRDANTIVAREAEPLLVQREEQEEDVAALLALAEQVEGLPRNVGMHAGGVLIAPGKLTDFCPMYSQDADSVMISQFDKDDVEAVGLVKFDFLGLTTLTILDWTIRFCKRLDPTFEIDLQTLSLDDQSVYQLFREANTVAIFQFESTGMKDLLVKARPKRLEDLTALNALYRPGPMDLIPDYIARRDGKQQAEYYDSRLQPMLEETLGIMVYQEQVMQAAQIIGGYSLGGADLLRRAMGKKKPEEMAKHRVIFNEGAAKNGLTEKQSNVLFSDMEKFAGYGFNKSHSAAYALLAYQTGYFKRHHAAAFMAANMSAVMNDTDKVRQLLEDCLTVCNLRFEAPDVNAGEYRFVPVDRATIRYGLGGVKGTGEGAVIEILRAREEGGPFTDLFDFCRRVNTQTVNRRTVEALIKAGAFDKLHSNRASAFASVGAALSEAERAQANASQNSLFGDDASVTNVALIDARPWDLLESLAQEKTALGLYLSGHPYEAYRKHLQPVTTMALARVEPSDTKQRLAGIVNAVRVINSRNGRICFLSLDDRTDICEVMIPATVFEAHRHWLKEDIPIVIEAKVSMGRDGGATRVIADQIFDIDQARAQFGRRLIVTLNGKSATEEAAALLAALKPFTPGPTPVFINVRKDGYSGRVELGEQWRVKPHGDLLAKLSADLEF
ncbi:MAG: DNA polymerase III subunit alpha [Betaproteobacteria bacterium]|nr:MAG: DNA polymerase III subunit alpha [Betaproteobacteria bacterium]